MMSFELEVCCGSLQSAVAAVEGGAQRIELCSALSLDGLTPSLGLLRELRSCFPALRIHVLIRPREGDFVYSEAEVRVMERDIRLCRETGASAIVSGALTPEGDIDVTTTARLVQAAGELPFTFHRAFDELHDPFLGLELLKGLRVARVLTSGCAPTAVEGVDVLRQLVQQAAGSVTILPGGGVNRGNARQLLQATGAMELHGSCSALLPDGRRQTSADEVRAVLHAMMQEAALTAR